MLIEKCLVLSTGHLSAQDESCLHRLAEDGFPIMLFPEGFNVITTFELKYYRGMSKTFKTLVKMAREHDCKWLLFDRDGEKLEGYKVYGW